MLTFVLSCWWFLEQTLIAEQLTCLSIWFLASQGSSPPPPSPDHCHLGTSHADSQNNSGWKAPPLESVPSPCSEQVWFSQVSPGQAQSGPEHLEGWGLHNLRGQRAPHGKKLSLYLIGIIHVPVCACCLSSHWCVPPRRDTRLLFILPSGICGQQQGLPGSFLLSRLNKPSSSHFS